MENFTLTYGHKKSAGFLHTHVRSTTTYNQLMGVPTLLSASPLLIVIARSLFEVVVRRAIEQIKNVGASRCTGQSK